MPPLRRRERELGQRAAVAQHEDLARLAHLLDEGGDARDEDEEREREEDDELEVELRARRPGVHLTQRRVLLQPEGGEEDRHQREGGEQAEEVVGGRAVRRDERLQDEREQRDNRADEELRPRARAD